MHSNPLSHVGQTAHPEDSSAQPDEQAGDAGDEARQQNQTDRANKPAGPVADKPSKAMDAKTPPSGDLQPGEPPPESSAGS